MIYNLYGVRVNLKSKIFNRYGQRFHFECREFSAKFLSATNTKYGKFFSTQQKTFRTREHASVSKFDKCSVSSTNQNAKEESSTKVNTNQSFLLYSNASINRVWTQLNSYRTIRMISHQSIISSAVKPKIFNSFG